jgi:NAD(P)H-hydrate epimerase
MAQRRLHQRDDEDRGAPSNAQTGDTVYLLDRDSVRAVDRAATEEFGIPGIVLMENASRGLAATANCILERLCAWPATVLIICGHGNNGGDGYALARHLHNSGHRPVLVPLGAPSAGSDAAINRDICRRISLPERSAEELDSIEGVDLVVDAIFGTGLDREVAGVAAQVIRWINRGAGPVLAVDTPSGLDCDTGKPLGATVRADTTVTFVGPKPGFSELDAQPFVGDVVVADIGVPIEVVRRYGRPVPQGPPDPHPRE